MFGIKNNVRDPHPSSFAEFLSAHKSSVVLLLVLAMAIRTGLAVAFPKYNDDQRRYTIPAVNLLAGRGFSVFEREPYLPTDHTVPLYSFFIAGVYATVGHRELAIRIGQSVIDLGTCLLVAFISFSLAPPVLRSAAAISALIIYGCLSWFTIYWTTCILTETLALFFTVLTVALATVARKKRIAAWLMPGVACGLAILTRADSVLLFSALALFFSVEFLRERTLVNLIRPAIFCAAVFLVLTPWTLRNYVSLGKFQPLASEYGFPRGGYIPRGYLLWLRTWMTDETYFRAFLPTFNSPDTSFSPREIPNSVFDSATEKERIFALFEKRKELHAFTAGLDDDFRAIAYERIRRAPFRFLVALPLTRIASVWCTSFSTYHRPFRALRILLVLPIIVGGILGFAFWAQTRWLNTLLILIILTRTLFLGYGYAPEARYIVEAYPAMIAACGVTAAAVWRYAKQRLERKVTN